MFVKDKEISGIKVTCRSFEHAHSEHSKGKENKNWNCVTAKGSTPLPEWG